MKLILSTPACPAKPPGGGAAHHDVEHPGGQPGLGRQFGEAQDAERGQLGGFGHDGVTGGEGRRRLLAHAHHRTVPRRDHRHHAIRLEPHRRRRPPPGEHLTVELVAPTRVVPDPRGRVDARAHDADRGPIVQGGQIGGFGGVLFETGRPTEENRRPGGAGASAAQPGWASRAAATAASTSPGPAEADLSLHLARGRVSMLVYSRGCARGPGVSDEVSLLREPSDDLGSGCRPHELTLVKAKPGKGRTLLIDGVGSASQSPAKPSRYRRPTAKPALGAVR